MKLLLALLLTLPQFAIGSSFTAPEKISGSQYLFRGSQPLGKVEQLRKIDIQSVVIFKNDVRGEVVREFAELAEAGYSVSQIHHIPMKWKEINLLEACEQTMVGLQILMKAERKGDNTFLHCTAGEDRTGMIAALARMLLTKESVDLVFADEMCANGYSDGNPKKPLSVTSEIEKGLTPLFFALAREIESGEITTENLLPARCKSIKVKPVLQRCH